MFPEHIKLEHVKTFEKGTLLESLGIEFTELGKETLTAKMPVDHRTWQPMKILHGGASLALAETVASSASNLIIDHETEYALGLELNGNHVRSAKDGYVFGTATPIHVGRKTHIWEIRITNEEGKLVSICRMTNIVLKK